MATRPKTEHVPQPTPPAEVPAEAPAADHLTIVQDPPPAEEPSVLQQYDLLGTQINDLTAEREAAQRVLAEAQESGDTASVSATEAEIKRLSAGITDAELRRAEMAPAAKCLRLETELINFAVELRALRLQATADPAIWEANQQVRLEALAQQMDDAYEAWRRARKDNAPPDVQAAAKAEHERLMDVYDAAGKERPGTFTPPSELPHALKEALFEAGLDAPKKARAPRAAAAASTESSGGTARPASDRSGRHKNALWNNAWNLRLPHGRLTKAATQPGPAQEFLGMPYVTAAGTKAVPATYDKVKGSKYNGMLYYTVCEPRDPSAKLLDSAGEEVKVLVSDLDSLPYEEAYRQQMIYRGERGDALAPRP